MSWILKNIFRLRIPKLAEQHEKDKRKQTNSCLDKTFLGVIMKKRRRRKAIRTANN